MQFIEVVLDCSGQACPDVVNTLDVATATCLEHMWPLIAGAELKFMIVSVKLDCSA